MFAACQLDRRRQRLWSKVNCEKLTVQILTTVVIVTTGHMGVTLPWFIKVLILCICITARLQIDQPLLVMLGYTHWSGHPRHHYHLSIVDGFQMSKKRATSGGKTHNQKAGVQLTFHFQKTSLLYFLVLVVRTQCTVPCLYCAHSCTERTHHSCPPTLSSGSEATPHACTVLMDT